MLTFKKFGSFMLLVCLIIASGNCIQDEVLSEATTAAAVEEETPLDGM